MNNFDTLAQRVAALDDNPSYEDASEEINRDVAHFIRTLEVITPPGDSVLSLPPVSAHAADEKMVESKLLNRLRAQIPEIAVGPLAHSRQYWVATGRPSHVPARIYTLDREQFVAAESAIDQASTKPFNLGMYSSTGVLGTFGMWWCYLQLNAGSTLFPRPWKVWSVRADYGARVREIASASEWVAFVSSYPKESNGFIYPNWKRVAHDWDGIHMTLDAVAATQGIGFSAGAEVLAPPYWDVESTLWLRWVFAAVEVGDIDKADLRLGRRQ